MKTLKIAYLILLSFFFVQVGKAQATDEEKLGLPGDNLNLYAVMKLFQESETLEGFEKNLNAEEYKINNLDLDGDNQIDYIRVMDYPDGDNHTIVLQVPVSQTENQDVAVFTVQKDSKGEVQVQLIGDESLYGKDYIIEPNYAEQSAVSSTPNPGYVQKQNGNNQKVIIKTTSYVEVASWPVVRYIYLPSYSVWHSPWYWGYYPSFWRPWRPYYWHYYYGYHYNNYHWYHGHYRHCNHYRYNNWNTFYYSNRRMQSAYYNHRRQNGDYVNTYSRPETRREGAAEYQRRNTQSRNGNDRLNNTVQRNGTDGNARKNRSGTIQNNNRGSNNNAGREKVDNNRSRERKVESRPSSGTNRKANVERPSNRKSNQVRPSGTRQSNVAPRSSGSSPTPRSSSTNNQGRSGNRSGGR